MTGWDVLNRVINGFPPVVMTLMLTAMLTATVILIIGYSKYGLNFLKFGFKQSDVVSSLDKRIDNLSASIDARNISFDKRIDDLCSSIDARNTLFDKRIDDLCSSIDTKNALFEKRFDELTEKNSLFDKRFDEMSLKIETIEINHFGHLKNYLGIVNGVLLDKNIIDNETKARLDNELRGM